jgi:hypothetical protein
MATKKPYSFEKSSKDKDAKGAKEGGKSDKAMDKKQAKLPAFMKKK